MCQTVVMPKQCLMGSYCGTTINIGFQTRFSVREVSEIIILTFNRMGYWTGVLEITLSFSTAGFFWHEHVHLKSQRRKAVNLERTVRWKNRGTEAKSWSGLATKKRRATGD